MIYVALPVGTNYGWGILGRQVLLEIAKIEPARLLLLDEDRPTLEDELDVLRMMRLLPNPPMSGAVWNLDGPVIHSSNCDLVPRVGCARSPHSVALAVFEEDILKPEALQKGRENFQWFATGSTHCAEVLAAHGIAENVSVVYHGVDSHLFSPPEEGFARNVFGDAFVIFGGGKFEFRKGQDVAIRAVKVMQDRHRDVVLLNSWMNLWPENRNTMAASRLIQFSPIETPDHGAWMSHVLKENGLDMNRVVTIGMRSNKLLPAVFHHSDVGIFANRAEGGTNMVMMEYMACGKPVVASYNTGHRDVLDENSPLTVKKHTKIPITMSGRTVAHWYDPDLDETIERLEWAYQNRGKLPELGMKARAKMQEFPWSRMARGLVDAANKFKTRG